MADGQIIIDTKIDSSGAEQGIEKLRGQLSGFANFMGLTFVADKVKDFGQSILTAGINFDAMKEQSIAAWSTILGSADKANNMFKEITNFAATTPFSQLGVDQMAKQLTNAGFKGKDLFNQLTKFGNMGSAFGVQEDSLKEMVRQYSQVQMAGVAYTEDLNILSDRGIPIYKALAEVMKLPAKTGVAMVKKMAGQGKITADIYNKAINQIANNTKGAMDKQANTFNGLVSTLKDNWSILAGTLSLPIFGKIKQELSDFLPKFQTFVDMIGKDGLANALRATFPQFTPLINVLQGLGNILTNIVVPIFVKFFTVIAEHAGIIGFFLTVVGSVVLAFKAFSIIQSVITLVQGLGIVFGILEAATASETAVQMALNLAFLANPIFLVVAGITALVGGFIYLWNTSEGFRNFWIGMWNGVKAITLTVINAIIKIFHTLINFIKNNWKQLLLFIVNPFAGAFALLYKHCAGFRNFIDNFVKAVINFFKAIPKNLVKIFNLAINVIKKWCSNVGKFFTQTIPKIIANVIKWFMQLPQKIGFALGYALGTIAKWGMNVWNFFTQTIPKWIMFIGQWFAKLPGLIWNWLVNAFQKVVAWGSNMLSKAISIGTNFVTNIVNFFARLPGQIWNFLSNVISKVISWGASMVSKAISIGTNFVTNIINFIKNLPSRLWSIFTNVVSKVVSWGSNLATAGMNAARRLATSIVDGVKSIPSKMISIGGDIVRGIWNGIGNMVGWLKDKIFGFAGGIVSGFKSALGIHSPARRLYSTGKYTIQGVGVGMDNEMPELNNQVHAHMTNMTEKMKATVKAETSGINFKTNFTNGISTNFKLASESNLEEKSKETDNKLIIPVHIAGKKIQDVIVPLVSNNLAINSRRRF